MKPPSASRSSFVSPAAFLPAETSDLLVANYDFLPSVLDYLGLQDKTAGLSAAAGKSFAPALRGDDIPWKNAIYHEFENTRMIRTPDWKLTLRHPYGPDELYNMKNDPGRGKT